MLNQICSLAIIDDGSWPKLTAMITTKFSEPMTFNAGDLLVCEWRMNFLDDGSLIDMELLGSKIVKDAEVANG